MKKRILVLLGLFIFTPFIFNSTLFCQGTEYVSKQFQSCQETGYSIVLTVNSISNDTAYITRSIRSSGLSDQTASYWVTSNQVITTDSVILIGSNHTYFIPFEGPLAPISATLPWWRFCCDCTDPYGDCDIQVVGGNSAKCKATMCSSCCEMWIYDIPRSKYHAGLLIDATYVVLSGL